MTIAYRFYNTKTKAHFFTTSEAERDNVRNTMPDFQYEGPVFESNAVQGAPGAEAVYRYFNTTTGVHVYVSNATERAALSANPSFNNEGIAYYSYTASTPATADDPGTIPLYRFLNTGNGVHFYTSSEAEKNNIIATLPIYKLEGIAYYISRPIDTPAGSSNAVIGNPSAASVTEGTGIVSASGTISITDPDAGEATFKTIVTSESGNIGSLSIAADGKYTYSVDSTNATIQALGAGDTRVEKFTVESADGTKKQISFTINGTASGRAFTTGDDNFTGTAGNDLYTATLGTAATLNSTDVVNSGSGTDHLNITTTAGAPTLTTPTLVNLENVTIEGAGGVHLDLNSTSGLLNVDSNIAGPLTFNNVSSSTTFGFGPKSSSANPSGGTEAAFGMKSGQTTLNLGLNGTTDDADIFKLIPQGATTVNIHSTGNMIVDPAVAIFDSNGEDQNRIVWIDQWQFGTTFKVTGNAFTSIASFSAGTGTSPGGSPDLFVDASALTNNFDVAGSPGWDSIKGSQGSNRVNGTEGFDIIDLTASSGNVDIVRLDYITKFEDRDLIIGFKAGAGGDIIQFSNSRTTHFNTGNAVIAQSDAQPQTAPVNISSFDMFEFDVTLTTGSISTSNAGQVLFDQIGFGLTSDLGTKAYFIIYGQSNTAALLYFENQSSPTWSPGDVQLVGVFEDIAVSSFDASNFVFV